MTLHYINAQTGNVWLDALLSTLATYAIYRALVSLDNATVEGWVGHQ